MARDAQDFLVISFNLGLALFAGTLRRNRRRPACARTKTFLRLPIARITATTRFCWKCPRYFEVLRAYLARVADRADQGVHAAVGQQASPDNAAAAAPIAPQRRTESRAR